MGPCVPPVHAQCSQYVKWQVATQSQCLPVQAVFLFVCVCTYVAVGWTLDHMVSFGDLFRFLGRWLMFSFVFFTSSSGDVKRLLGTFPRCDHVDRVLLGVNGYRLKVMGACPALSRPSQAPASVGRPLAGKYRAFIATQQAI